MVKKIAIIATNGYEDLELHYPNIRLKEAGYETELISLSKDVVKGKWGYPFKPELTIDEANPSDYDGLVLPGGAENPDHLRRYRKVLDFVTKIDQQGKLIAAICHAGWVLISAKILKDRKATSYFADLPDFMKAILKYLSR